MLVAGSLKLAEPEPFALAISYYHLLARQMLQPLAYLLPPLEIFAALALFAPGSRRAAWLLCGALFAVFSLAVGSAVARGLDVSCGCFGGSSTVSWWHLLGNLLLAGLCFRQALRKESGPWRAPLALLVACAALLACAHHAVRADRPLFAAPRNPGYSQLSLVDLDTVSRTLEGARTFLLDARPAGAYRRGTLPGALSVPLHSALEEELLAGLRTADRIIIFCGGPSCNASKELAVILRARGLEQTSVFVGGVEEWRNSGRPLAPGGSGERDPEAETESP